MPPHHPQLQTLTFQSPVGRWRLHLWTPSPDLAPAVAQLWAVESDTREFQEKVLPRGTVEFMINLGDPHHLLSEDGVAHRRKHAWISGLQTACLHVHSPHPARLIAASLYPAHAPLLLDAPAQELSTRVHEWENPSLRALRERLLHTPTSIARFALLEDYLRARQRRARPLHPGLAWAARMLTASHGETRIAHLQSQLRVSRRHLAEQFRQHVGLSPKSFARLLRFDQTIATARQLTEVHWTNLAVRCGYFDQAHFIRDFRRFTGCTPTEFLATRDPSGQAMLVDPI